DVVPRRQLDDDEGQDGYHPDRQDAEADPLGEIGQHALSPEGAGAIRRAIRGSYLPIAAKCEPVYVRRYRLPMQDPRRADRQAPPPPLGAPGEGRLAHL